jgi:hypothetical protein
MRMMDYYTEKLKIADENIMNRFQNTTRRFDMVFWLDVISSILIIGISLVLMTYSLRYILNSDNTDPTNKILGSGGILVSFGILVVILSRNPLKQIRATVADLVKMNVIFMGYVRQINQIDMTFKVLFEDNGADLASMEKTVRQIRETVEQTIDNVSRALEELDGTSG